MTVATIKSGSVALRIRQMPDGRYRFSYTDATGRQLHRTNRDLDALKTIAGQTARSLSRSALDFNQLTKEQMAVCAEVVRLGWTLDDVRRIASDSSNAQFQEAKVDEAVKLFLEAKLKARGRSTRYTSILSSTLGIFSDDLGHRPLQSITPAEIEQWQHRPLQDGTRIKAKTYNNRRASLVTFFRWCRSRGMLPESRKTAPERTEKRREEHGTITTWKPAELRKLLDHVHPDYLPWLAITNFAGIRAEELCPPNRSDKSPLDWSDLDFKRKIIIVRPETAKTGRRRIVPMCDALIAWLKPHMQKTGRISPFTSANNRETKRLGALLGTGWRRNASRHSFGSYRAAIVKNIGQVAMEMGNSISECESSYHDAKTEDDAKAFFNVMPRKVTRSDSAIPKLAHISKHERLMALRVKR